MEFIWIIVAIEYVAISGVFGRSYLKTRREMQGKPIRKIFSNIRNRKASLTKNKIGLANMDSETIDMLYKHLKVPIGYHDDELSKLRKLDKTIKKKLTSKAYKQVHPYVVISILANLIKIKGHLKLNKIKPVPTPEELAKLIVNNVSASRIMVLYTEGLSVESILESRSISQAHAIALYS